MYDQTPDDAAFTTDEGLRELLQRLAAHPEKWHTDPEARALLTHVRGRYERLSRKWGRDPDEAVTAAYDAMLADYTLTAEMPWAIVTLRVSSALSAETRAEKLLIDPKRAQKEDVTGFERPVRAGEHEDYLYDLASTGEAEPEPDSPLVTEVQATATRLLACLDWDRDLASAAIEWVMTRLLKAMDTHRAYRYLRRDNTGPALLDLEPESWRALVRILLGSPGSPGLSGRRGLIARILIELESGLTPVEVIDELLRDDRLIIALFHLRPRSS